jgi:hypothetical protein
MTTKKTNPWTLYAVFGITAIPLMIAMVMYFNLWGVPNGRTNFGELLLPPNQLEQTQLVDEKAEPWSQEEADKRLRLLWVRKPIVLRAC